MRDMSKMLSKATVQGIADSMLSGSEKDLDKNNYKGRVEKSYVKLENAAKEQGVSHLMGLVNELIVDTAKVYTEIGICAGIQLMRDVDRNIHGECDRTGKGKHDA